MTALNRFSTLAGQRRNIGGAVRVSVTDDWLQGRTCYGGLIAALADNAMGLSCVAVLTGEGRKPEGGLVTVSMATDFIGAAKLGQWVMVDTQYVKTGRTLCFAQAFVTADGEVIARADARFKVS